MSATEKIGVEQVFRVSKTGDIIYINLRKIAETFKLEPGDQIRVQIKEKILTTYE